MSTTEDLAFVAWMDEAHEQSGEAERRDAEAKAEWVAGLCEGHESLRGDSMGAEVYCDGTCRPLSERDDDAWVEYLEGSFPDDC